MIFVLWLGNASQASVLGDASLWLQNKFSNKSCDNLSQNDLNNLNSAFKCEHSRQAFQKDDYNKIAEYSFFNHVANEEFAQTQCQLAQVDLMSKNTKLQKEISYDLYNKLPFIKEQATLAQKAYATLLNNTQSLNQEASYCRNLVSPLQRECYNNLEKSRTALSALEKKWQQHQAYVLASISSVWNGNTAAMQKMIFSLSNKKPLPNADQIEKELQNTLPQVKKEFTNNLKNLSTQSQIINGQREFNNLNDSTKRNLIENSLNSNFLHEAAQNKDESAVKLLCRLEGQYTKGRDTLENTAIGATFLLGAGAGLLTKIPLAARAGSLARLTAGARSSSPVLGYAAIGIDAAVITNSVNKSCFSSTPVLSVKSACASTDSDYEELQLQKINDDNCILSAALDLAPAGILTGSIIAGALKKNIERYRTLANNYKTRDLNQIRKLDSSDKITAVTNVRQAGPEANTTLYQSRQSDALKYLKDSNLQLKKAPSESPAKKQILSEHNDRLTKITNARKRSAEGFDYQISKIKADREKLQQDELILKNQLQKLESTPQTAQRDMEIQEVKRKMSAYKEVITDLNQEIALLEKDKALKLSIHDNDLQQLEQNRMKNELMVQEDAPYPSSVDLIAANSLRRNKLTLEELKVIDETRELRDVYILDKAPKANPKASGKSVFWENPQFANELNELENLGVKVILDPNKISSASYYPGRKAIYLNPQSSYHVFKHEFTHAQFDAYVAPIVDTKELMIQNKFKQGTQLKNLLNQSEIQKIGEKNIDALQKNLENYHASITVNESFAVHKELQSLGWNPLSAEYLSAKAYGAYYRADELIKRKEHALKNSSTSSGSPQTSIAFSKKDEALLDQELKIMSNNLSLMRAKTGAAESLQKIRTNIRNGNTAQALAGLRAVRTEIERSEKNSAKIFYTRDGQIIKVSPNGKSFEYLNLKTLQK